MKFFPILLISGVLLQGSYTVPLLLAQEPIIFSSRSAEDTNTRITFSVAFDKDQNAVITSSSSTAKQEDEEAIHM